MQNIAVYISTGLSLVLFLGCIFLYYQLWIYKARHGHLETWIDTQDAKKAWFKQNLITDEKNQIKAVKEYDGFISQRIFNKGETQVFYLLKDLLKHPDFTGWHVHGQVSFGQIIKTDQKDRGSKANRAHQSINSKRADMVVTDRFGDPVAIIEYIGGGHWGTDRVRTQMRDQVKQIAAKKAGIELVHLFPDEKMDRTAKRDLLLNVFANYCFAKPQFVRE